DTDHDGVIDAVDVIHVGQGYEYSGNVRCIHSHYGNLTQQNADFQSQRGMWFNAYHTEPELRYGGRITQIGAICHETAHFFGAPDLYDYNGVSSGLGMWSLMSGGAWGGPPASWSAGDGTKPIHPDAYIKQFLGFVTPRLVSASSAQVLRPVESNPEILKVSSGMPGQQYFLAENRQKTGYDQYLPGSGLAIYHVDEAQADLHYDYQQRQWAGWNLDPDHYLVDLEQADGRRQLNTSATNEGDAQDLYPTGAATFGPTTTPNTRPYGSSTASITFDSIGRRGSDITLNVLLGDGGSLALGQACVSSLQCRSGFCADSVCCNTACSAGACDACSVAAGASSNGTCASLTVACDDGNPCTEEDACQLGACLGKPKSCASGGSCTSPGTCSLTTGACEGGQPLPDGTDCNDNDLCTRVDACAGGVCIGSNPKPCHALDQCHKEGGCDWRTGECIFPVQTNGSACDTGDPGYVDGQCTNGECVGTPVGAECEGKDDGTACSSGICRGGVCGAPDPGCGGCAAASHPLPTSLLLALLLAPILSRTHRRRGRADRRASTSLI
ncbi:MAG: M6 family metalloprotease domain-containing protein, partial [Deltaproteobacteria bacterium]|nr:M6 family metalloprotease domain-containing protein [Deltaproteobacteria bacterium]